MLGFITSSPCFRGEGEIVPNFAQKCDDDLIHQLVINKLCYVETHTHTHTPIYWPFFRVYPGEPVPER